MRRRNCEIQNCFLSLRRHRPCQRPPFATYRPLQREPAGEKGGPLSLTVKSKGMQSLIWTGRQRRSIVIDSEIKRDAEFDLDGVTKHNGDVESSKDELSEVEAAQTNEREGKFLLYWMTTTSTSTTYTATTTVSSLDCTPSGFVISNCTG